MTGTSRGVRVLLTGGTGFVGKVVLSELVRRRHELGLEEVYVVIRPRGRRTAGHRFEKEVASSPCFERLESGWTELCHPVTGDITQHDLGLADEEAERLQQRVTHVIHCAASVQFDLSLGAAARANITGALNVLAFAQRCVAVPRLVAVSTAYVTPHPGADVPIVESLVAPPFDADAVYAAILDGSADEPALLSAARQPNTYTLTKCIAEVLLSQRRGDVPLTIVRPSIISACRRFPFPGWIDSRAAYAAFVALLGAGYLRAVKVDLDVRADIVPCDDVADRILACAFDPRQQQPMIVRHAVAGRDQTATFDDLSRHQLYFQAHPHERPARLRYRGKSAFLFRVNELLYHSMPLRVAGFVARLRKQRGEQKRIRRVQDALRSLDSGFHYFRHLDFDFQSSFPPLEGFDVRSYIQTVSAGISQHLLKRDPRVAPLQMHGMDAAWALRQPHGNLVSRALAYCMRKVIRLAGIEITFDEMAIEAALRETGPDDVLVLAPTHRSYMDFMVTSLLCFAHPGIGLRLPRVAATDDFAHIPFVGHVLKAAGAFFIRRGAGKPDPALNEKLGTLVSEGHSLAFYPEGMRSRSRRFRPAKRGVLRAVQGTGRSAVVLPLSITYDRVAEESGFLRELEGGPRHTGRLVQLARWVGDLMRGRVQMGRIHIRCGAPLPLDASTDVRELSRDLMAALQKNTVATSFHLRAFCAAHANANIDLRALRSEIERRGGMVLDSGLEGAYEVPDQIRRTFDAQWMHLFYDDAMKRFGDEWAVRAHVRRNGFWVAPRVAGDNLLSHQVVTALFTPIIHDYSRVASEVNTFPADGLTVSEVLRRLPGSFQRDVEDAMDELLDSGVLERDGDVFRPVTAPLSDSRNPGSGPGARARSPIDFGALASSFTEDQ